MYKIILLFCYVMVTINTLCPYKAMAQESAVTSFSFGEPSITSFTFGETSKITEVSKGVDTELNDEENYDASNPVFDLSARSETAYFLKKKAKSDITSYITISPEVTWRMNDNWDIKLSADIDYYTEISGHTYDELNLRFEENYISYAEKNIKVTAGQQKIIWGRTDGIKPTDQLGADNLRSFVKLDLEDRKLAVPSIRAEYFGKNYKLDTVVLYKFKPTKLADHDSIWSLIDRDTGDVVGVKNNPLKTLTKDGTFDHENNQFGGGGMRFSTSGKNVDWAVTAQRIRRSVPFYKINPDIVADLGNGVPVGVAMANANGDTFKLHHPWNWVVGGDFSIPIQKFIFRAEGAVITDTPVYKTNLEAEYITSIQTVMGVEFYPGDADFRTILQLSSVVMPNAKNILDRHEVYTFNGSLENEYYSGKLIASMDFSMGINDYDLYLNPRLLYGETDRNKFYVEGHYFDGSDVTANGYFSKNSHIAMGWVFKL